MLRLLPLLCCLSTLALDTNGWAASRSKTAPVKAMRSIPPRAKTVVAGVDVSGLDRAALERRLRRELKPKLEAKIFLSDGARRVARRRRDIGVELDLGWMIGRARGGTQFVPLRLRVDRSTLERALRRMARLFQTSPCRARIGLVRGRMKIVPERIGRSLNLDASVARVKAQIEREAATRLVNLVARLKTPRVTRQTLKGITGKLTSFSTSFNPANLKRTQNMKLAIHAIDDTVIAPGATFSLNKTVGERTQARGYRTAIIFQNGYKVPGIGAGVSQVTGTLFNAALLAGLPIIEYRTHSRPVAYLPLGRDATVAWGSFDMKWKNNTHAPIYIDYQISGDRITATLFGRRTPGQDVRLRVLARNLGPRQKAAQLFRTIRRGSKIVKKERIGISRYNWKEGAWEN
jgi:vancomycin resistance protein YoaR